MEDFKERLKQEYIELNKKTEALGEALSSNNFKNKVGDVQNYLLFEQMQHMIEYRELLKVRMYDLGIKLEEDVESKED